MRNRIKFAAGTVLYGMLMTGCYDYSTAPRGRETVTVPQTDVTMDAIGRTTQLSAAAFDGWGNVVPAPILHWSSSNPGVATVDETGKVTALTEGEAIITVSYGYFGVASIAVHVEATIDVQAQITTLLNPMVNPEESTATTQVVVQARTADGATGIRNLSARR